MSPYDSVMVGKLKLKGKALDVKACGIKKKKKHDKRYYNHEDTKNEGGGKENGASYDDDYLSPAEKQFLEQTQKLEFQRLAKMASRSHRDRVQEFNQYLANISEHYDIPKVGPG